VLYQTAMMPMTSVTPNYSISTFCVGNQLLGEIDKIGLFTFIRRLSFPTWSGISQFRFQKVDL